MKSTSCKRDTCERIIMHVCSIMTWIIIISWNICAARFECIDQELSSDWLKKYLSEVSKMRAWLLLRQIFLSLTEMPARSSKPTHSLPHRLGQICPFLRPTWTLFCDLSFFTSSLKPSLELYRKKEKKIR